MESFASTDNPTPRQEPQQANNALSFQDLMRSMKPNEPQSQQQNPVPNVLHNHPLPLMSTFPGDRSAQRRFSADEFLIPPEYEDASNKSGSGDVERTRKARWRLGRSIKEGT